MGAAMKSIWKNTLTETIDQSSLELPPAWVPTVAHRGWRNEQGHSIYASGRERCMANAVVRLLTIARDRAVVSSFLLADKDIEDAILNAARRGVRVYVLLASEARLGREDSEGEFDKRVLEQHKAMLTRLGGHVLFRSAPHFHAKVVVVDPETRPAGILLTANLTTEALERNDELAVALKATEVVEITKYLRWAMWESAEHELLDPNDRFKATRPLGIVPHPTEATTIVATTAEAELIREELLRLIDQARSKIIVSSFGWDQDHEVIRRICARAREGLDVTVLARIRPASMPALLKLAEAGASVYGFKWLHAKAIWTDREQALLMSANLQSDGLDHGFELGVRLEDTRVRELHGNLAGWIKSAPWRLINRPKLGEVHGVAKVWQRGQLSDVEIKSSMNVTLDEVTASSADALITPRPPLLVPYMAHKLDCTWTVAAPTLAQKSKEQKRPALVKEQTQNPKDQKKAAKEQALPQPYSPKVFREPNGRLVVAVNTPDELSRARVVMAEVGATAIVTIEGAT
jgi:cardiolipin synthase